MIPKQNRNGKNEVKIKIKKIFKLRYNLFVISNI